MLYLLDKDVRTVRWNGEPLHEATSAIVKETMNGDFTLTVKYPISDSGIYQLIQEDMLIKAPTPVLGAQLFRIKKPVEHNDHLEITAYHISDDVMQRSITPISVTSQSCGMALSRMVQNTKTALGDFSFNSDIQDRRTFNTTETETLYSVLLDGKHSIVGTWEGELVRDNFAMTVKKSRGENRGVVITTHKNLKDYQRTKNSQNVVTRIHAKSTFKPEGAEKETTIRVTVDSPLINSYPYINEKEYENNNAKSAEELQKWAQAKFSNEGIDKVSDAIKIEAYELDGQVVHMGDTVNLKSWKHNVDSFKKAIAYEFDSLKEEYISLTFDDKAGTGGSRASGGLSSAADAILGVTESAQEIALEKALQNADLGFDHQAGLLRQEILDGIELAKAKAEETKQEIFDSIGGTFESFRENLSNSVQVLTDKALEKAGASSLLAQEAKQIGYDAIARLEAFKDQTYITQSTLTGNLDLLKQTVNNEVNQASEHRRTTTEALSRMTGQMNGFATKSEVKQGIDGLTQTFAKMKVGSRNYAEDYDFSRGLWIYSQGDSSPRDWTINNGEYNIKGTTNTYKQMQIYSKEGSRTSGKNSTALLDLDVGETYTLSFQGICYSGSPNVWVSLRANRTSTDNPEIMYGNFNLTSSWQTYQVTIPALTKPDNFDFWRIILGYNGIGHVAFRKVELTRSSTRIDAGPAPEDGKTDLVVAKSEFQKTAEGLRTDLSAIQEYVNKDGQRQEALQRYTREESARQASVVRELVSRDYVGKATHQEDVRGIERRLEAITNPQSGTIATQIANYKQSVDGRLTDITSLIYGKVNQTDFQHVKETSQLYERILGNTDNGIADNVARMALTNQLFQVEVTKASASGRNLFLNSLFKRDLRKRYSTYDLFDGKDQTQGQLALSIDTNEKFKGANTLKIVSTFNGKQSNQKATFTIGGDARLGTVDEMRNKSVRFSFWAKSTVNNTILQARPGYRGSLQSVPISTDWKFYDIELVRKENSNATSELILHIFTVATVWIAFPKIETGTVSTPFSEAPEDTDEAIRTVQSQLAGSWAVQNLTSAGSIVSQINATNNQILIEAEKIRLKGKTLLDELTAIQGYFKRLFVGEGTFATLNADVIRTNSITADKLVMDMAMARRFVSSDLFTDTLAAKEAFINKLRSVVVTATLLEGYRGRIGGFQIGTHDNDPSSFWLTGLDQFKVGMSNGRGREFQTAFWANWGNTWGKPGPLSWYVTLDGQMYCNNNATFHRVVDFSSTCSVNFYGANSFYKDIYMRNGSEIYGTGSTPRSGGKNSVVWWNQVGDGSLKYHIDMASDKRLKENIVDSNIVALDKIKQLKMKSFDFISTGKHEEVGLIAQEVEAVLPSVISKNPEKADDYLHIDYVAIVPYLIKSIQELNQKIEEMEKNVA